jgi:hypothetical protein
MPLSQNFISNIPFPEALLEREKEIVIPIADRSTSQHCPLYAKAPGMEGSYQIKYHIDEPVEATRFGLAETFYGGRRQFLVFAEVMWPHWPHPAYLNIWAGKNLERDGVLYCSVQRSRLALCLGGQCERGWFDAGWTCEAVSLPTFSDTLLPATRILQDANAIQI